jgi:hypothetical protein
VCLPPIQCSGSEIYLICGETVCMSVWCAVDRGVYLICGVTVCMPDWCPVDREFIHLCGENVIFLPRVHLIMDSISAMIHRLAWLPRLQSEFEP